MKIVLDEVRESKITNNPAAVLREDWYAFVEKHPNGNFFQSPAAYDFFSATSSYNPHVFFALRNDEITGVLLAIFIRQQGTKGYFSRRCIVWGGPLVLNNDKNTASMLIQQLNNKISDLSIFTEFRNLFDTQYIRDLLQRSGYIYEEELNFIVKTSPQLNPLYNLNESKQRQIKKSIKHGAQIVEAQSLQQVQDFYLILSKLFKEKVRKPLPEVEFFETFYNQRNLGKIFVVLYNKKVVGGIVCPIFKDTIYELYVCGMDKDYNNIHPSVLATWAPIYYGWKEGLKYFDFMGAGKPDIDYGVRDFKSQFGGEQVSYGRYRKVNSRFMYRIGKLGLALNQLLSSMII